MSEFDRAMPRFRFAEILRGDTLQTIAGREMGDANRWPELVWINRLSPPYVTDDDRLAGPAVLLSGQLIKVPAPAGVWNPSVDRGQVYERDCALSDMRLDATPGGDLAVVAGADNLRQQLKHRISTPMGQATRHPSYGCLIWRLVGKVTGPTAGMLGAEYVKSSLLADYRVSRVAFSRADVVGDAVRIEARAEAIEGSVIDLRAGEE